MNLVLITKYCKEIMIQNKCISKIFLYLLLYIFIFSIIFETNKKCNYYKCIITDNYLKENIIPLCSVDIKYRLVKFYAYFLNTNTSKYYLNTKSFYLHNYRNALFDYKINISIKKIVIKKKKISLCLVSIYSNLNIINVVRTCLMYRKLGVDHVTLYISFYDRKYKKYYDWFKTRDWIEIIHFSIPKVSIFYFGQDAKLDHCINHYRYISSYVIVTDVDEIILPVEKKNILDIINKYGKNNSVFSFKSVLFHVNNIKSNVFLTTKTGCMIKSGYEKMIIRPEKIVSIGAHFPKIWQENGKIIYISTNDAYVRHARIKGGNKQLSTFNCNRVYEVKYLSYLIQKVEYYIKWI